MNSGNVLKRCCYRSMRENKKRTSVTILGIILATALVTGVACMAVSFRKSLIYYEKQQNGDFHYLFTGVDSQYLKYFENNGQIAACGLVQEIGYAYLAGSQNVDKPYLHISAIEEGMEERLALHLSEGRMPENDGELAVGRHVRSNGLVDVKVGDVLTLDVGSRLSDGYQLGQESAYQEGEEALADTVPKTYTVVGIIDRPNQEVEPRIAPGYSAFTCLTQAGGGCYDVYVSYTDSGLRQRDQVTAGLLGVSEDLYCRYYGGQSYTDAERQQIRTVAKSVRENYWLLKWELMIFSSRTINMLYGMCAVAIVVIIVTSVFCIRNSFVISLTEKMKLYGRLSSVGTTAAQQRKIVYYEAAFLGLAGIPAGVAGGVLATLILVKAVGGLAEDALGYSLIFGVSLPAIALAAVLSMVTVYASAVGSARRAARISPISAIRANDTIKISRRELRCPALIGGIFGIGGRIAYKNLRRSRIKYRTTVISIVVSVAVFIGMSTFVELMRHASDYYYGGLPYQINASIYQWEFYGKALEITRLEGVQESEVVRSALFSPDPLNLNLAEEYKRDFKVWEKEPVVVMSIALQL